MAELAQVISGKKISAGIREEIASSVAEFSQKHGRVPGLSVVLVGSRKDSATYVRMKKKACEKTGITSSIHKFDESVEQKAVMECVESLNKDPSVDGILVQLPLPKHIDESTVLKSISPFKDVDGLHPTNVGDFVLNGLKTLFIPCTPKGCIELITRSGYSIEGKHAVVLGRSNIVGKPVSLLLQAHNATVTMCHSRTRNLPEIVRSADIVVAAVGKANFVKGDWIKPGAVVIDVGINAVDDATKKAGYRLVGDVDYTEASKYAGAITPVPGGVGPMTIAMLLSNTLRSAEASVLRE